MNNYINNVKTLFENFTNHLAPSASLSGNVTPQSQDPRRSSILPNSTEPVNKIDNKVITSLRSERRQSAIPSLDSNSTNTLAKKRMSLMTTQSGKNISPDNNDSNFGLGSLRFTLYFDVFISTLRIRIEEGKNLFSKDSLDECNSFVTICIHPGNFVIKKSKTANKSINPKFNETMIFKDIEEIDLKNLTLNAKVHEVTLQFGNRLIGEINYPLRLLINKRVVEFEKDIMPINKVEIFRGRLMVSLCLNSNKTELVVYIIAGKDLKALDSKYSDPFCTMRLSTSTATIGSKKTSVKYKTLTPFWNESFFFTVTKEEVKNNLSLELKVFDKDKDGQELIGELLFSQESHPGEAKHWQTMMDKPGEAISEWHCLRFGN